MASTEITVEETQRRKGSIKESWIYNCREKEEASEQQLKLYLMLSPNQQQFISAYTGQPLDHRLYIQNPLLPCTMNLRKKHMKIRNILGTFIGKTDFIFPSKHMNSNSNIFGSTFFSITTLFLLSNQIIGRCSANCPPWLFIYSFWNPSDHIKIKSKR